MPYESRAQQGLFHSKNSPVSAKVVAEFDRASKGQHGLPYHVKHPKGNHEPMHMGKSNVDISRMHSTDAKDYGH